MQPRATPDARLEPADFLGFVELRATLLELFVFAASIWASSAESALSAGRE